MKRLVWALLTVGLSVGVAGRAEAQYAFTALESINPLAQRTVGLGINNLGQIVGFDQTTFRGFLLSGTSYSPVGPSTSEAWGINDSGDIVGGFLLPPSRTRGFLYSGGMYTLVHVPDTFSTYAYGINNSGEIVGGYDHGGLSGFLLSGGSYTTFTVPRSMSTVPYKINDSDQIVGIYKDDLSSPYKGFLLSGGSYSSLDVPGSTETIAGGINNSGEIAGYYTAGGTQHGFLLSEGSYTTLDVPGSTVTAIWGINDAGQIVGGYLDTASALHGFVATPTPEPSTLLLLSLASVGLIVMARRGNLR